MEHMMERNQKCKFQMTSLGFAYQHEEDGAVIGITAWFGGEGN